MRNAGALHGAGGDEIRLDVVHIGGGAFRFLRDVVGLRQAPDSGESRRLAKNGQ